MFRIVIAMSLAALLCACKTPQEPDVLSADIAVYGGTSAGVVAAIQAAKEGKSVVLLAPETHLGAMSSSGLGFTDSGKTRTIGGLAREFYHRIWKEYQKPEQWKFERRSQFSAGGQGTRSIDDEHELMWIFEPHVATRVFEDWVREYPQIILVRGEYLNRESGVEKVGGRIKSITTLNNLKVCAKVFIDATFEGDLMAASGCKYAVGRESNSQYGEDFNGYRATLEHNGHHFKKDVDAHKIKGDRNSGLLKYVSDETPLPIGTGDDRIQAYCYRMCLTDEPSNMIEIGKPENYNPEDYELYIRYAETEPDFFPLIVSTMPNRKTDCNNKGAFSIDFIGENYAYPEADYAQRAKIAKAHKDYQLGLLYFWKTDKRVPAHVREKIAKFGLPKDEFLQSENWPFYLYVREARRMLGSYVMTQRNCQNTADTPKSVGMGSYSLDSHNASRYEDDCGFVQNEGDTQVRLKEPYKISYGAIIPRKADCENLLVPVACSATHIAYGSIRMEPVFMILGQSAAVAAAMASTSNSAVQDVDYGKLSSKLIADGQILENPRK